MITYLFFSISLHLVSIYIIVKIAQKLKAKQYQTVSAIFVWLTYFSLTSEWMMGQFNLLAGMFLLFAIYFELFEKRLMVVKLGLLSLFFLPAYLAFIFLLLGDLMALM